MYDLSTKKNIIKILAPIFFIVGLFFSLILFHHDVAFAAPGDTGTTGTSNNGGQAATDTSNKDSSDITCAIEKMGWILCPIIETSGKIGDQAFNFLANNFLQTEPELISNSPSGTKAAWELARNLANIMFIIAFLVIILSQVTGQGLNNYGVKKMLPRLVIAAIAVNVSYYICQLMVDLTNILGFEIQRFLVNTAAGVSDKAALPVQTRIDNQTSNGALGSMATGILGITTVVWFLLPMLFLGVGTVVITCIVIIVILLLRKAFIVLLVVVSPIAFVAYILPNTEKLFQKWGRMFWQLLLVFPIVGMLFGGGQLASAIVLVAGSSADAYKDQGGKCIQLPPSKIIDEKGNAPKTNPASTAVKDCDKNGGSTPFLLGLIAAGIAVAPMLAVWSVLKGALSAAGAIGGKISGAVQNAGNKATGIARKPEDALRRAAVGAARTSLTANALKGGFGKGTARFVRRRQTTKARQDARIKTAQAGFDAGPLGNGDALSLMKQQEEAGIAQRALQAQYDDARPGLQVGSGLGPVANYAPVAQSLTEADRRAGDREREELSKTVRAIQDGIDIRNLDAVADKFEAAMNSGDMAAARAHHNVLMSAGAAGQERFDRVIGDGSGYSAASLNNIKDNMVFNNQGALTGNLAYKSWATGTDNNLSSISTSAGTYDTTVEKFAAQSSYAQKQGLVHMSDDMKDSLRTAVEKGSANADRIDPTVKSTLK